MIDDLTKGGVSFRDNCSEISVCNAPTSLGVTDGFGLSHGAFFNFISFGFPVGSAVGSEIAGGAGTGSTIGTVPVASLVVRETTFGVGAPEPVPNATSALTRADAGAAGTAEEVTGLMEISSPVTGSIMGNRRLTGFAGSVDEAAELFRGLSDTLMSLEVVIVRCGCSAGPEPP